MTFPEWVRPSVFGAIGGAVALSLVGFSWGGWETGASARQLARDTARTEVVAALVPICVAQASQDPNAVATVGELKEAEGFQRTKLLLAAGWATMPGANAPDRQVATGCADELAAQS